MAIAFEVLAEQLLASAWDLLPAWLPNGRRQGREWCVGSLEGEAGQSLKINLDSGRWQDFATGVRGGDLIALYAAMRGLSQGEAAQQLGADTVLPVRSNGAHGASDMRAPSSPPPPAEDPHEPLAHQDPARERPPADIAIAPQHFKHPVNGVPAYLYTYCDEIGEPLCVVARYEGSEGKTFAPWSWGGGRWRMRMPARPRPLYGLDRLARLDRRVVVVEGEKAADALQGVVQHSPVITWMAGAVNWRYADWRPLASRSVLLWPDADPPGVEAMQGVAAVLLRLGCRVLRVDVEGLPDGYDAADAVAAGLVGDELVKWLRPRTLPLGPAAREPQRLLHPAAQDGAVTISGAPAQGDEPPPHTEADNPERLRNYDVATLFSLKLGPRGPHPNLSNATLMVTGMIQRKLLPDIWWDSFLMRVCTPQGEWSDHETLELLARLQHDFDFEQISRETVDQGVALAAWGRRRNCAQEWLHSLTWDGTERLDYLLSDGFGTGRTPYTMAVGRCFVMGMVARVMMPGCQVDNLPVFEGEQGITKSQALRALGGAWYAETMESVLAKDFYLALAGKMLVEVSEFSSFRRAESEAIKAAISRPTDRYRVPYDRRTADHPRSCVFAATANDTEWNRDPTGARRFWPVKCGHIDLGWLQRAREQLFAEAFQRVARMPFSREVPAIERVLAGAAWWDVPAEEARREQDARYFADTVATAMRSFVTAQRSPFTIMDVIRFGLNMDAPQCYDLGLQSRVRAQLLQWGYRTEIGEGGEKVWSRKEKPPEE